MKTLLPDFERQHLSRVSPGRRTEQVRVLADFADWMAVGSPGCAPEQALRMFLDAQQQAGYAPGTLRKWRAMILAFYGWAHGVGQVSGDTLLAIRGVPVPEAARRRSEPRPYRVSEIRDLWGVLDGRWPKLPQDEWRYWLTRWKEGRSPYTRVRVHGIRLQLDAIISLALCCGLRRREILALGEPWVHYDNLGVVVWGDAGPWKGTAREVPYTDTTRAVIREWIEYRAAIRPGHEAAWLNLWSEGTMREPMSRDTFDRLPSTYVGTPWTYRRLRDTCATSWANAGLPLEHLRRLLGLATLNDTLPYAGLASGRLEQKMEQAEPAFLRSIGGRATSRVAA